VGALPSPRPRSCCSESFILFHASVLFDLSSEFDLSVGSDYEVRRRENYHEAIRDPRFSAPSEHGGDHRPVAGIELLLGLGIARAARVLCSEGRPIITGNPRIPAMVSPVEARWRGG